MQTSTPSPHQNKHQKHPAPRMARLEDAHGYKPVSGQTLPRALPHPLHVGLRRMPLVYGFLVELRSLLNRMVLRSKRRYDLYGLDLGPAHQGSADGHLELNTQTHACTQDIESFVEAHPWATIVDVEMYRDAWVRGAAWAGRNSCRPESRESTQRTSG